MASAVGEARRAPSWFSRLARDPLFHFAVLGALLVTAHAWLAPPPRETIEVTPEIVRGLRQDHQRRHGRPPTEAEEEALVNQFVDNEILVREAGAIGLERGDVIVRRRLLQKMEFLLEREGEKQPTDAQLLEYFDDHQDRYTAAEAVSFEHVFAAADRPGTPAEQVIRDWRGELVAGTPPSAVGDPFLHGRELTGQTEADLATRFGDRFAAAVMALPPRDWSEPIASSYGLHLVRVHEHVAGRVADFATVREAVRRDWDADRRQSARREAMAALRRRYDVRVQLPSPGATPSPPGETH